MSTQSVNRTIREFIARHFSTRTTQLTDESSLLKTGVVDSMGVLEIVSFIEAEFNVQVNDEDLVPENFDTIGRIANYVETKQRSIPTT